MNNSVLIGNLLWVFKFFYFDLRTYPKNYDFCPRNIRFFSLSGLMILLSGKSAICPSAHAFNCIVAFHNFTVTILPQNIVRVYEHHHTHTFKSTNLVCHRCNLTTRPTTLK